MLGKTANGLTWMARYIERAENMTRLIEAGARMSLTRQGRAEAEWNGILTAAGAGVAYKARHGERVTAQTATDFLLRDPSNPGNVMVSVEMARTNARTVRTAITREVWEAANDAYLDLKDALREPVEPEDLPDMLARIRRHGALIRGTFGGTMLRNEIYDFSSVGTYLERVDATARMLDVKYFVLLPKDAEVGDELDLAQWEQLLRSFGVNRAFLMVHGTEYAAATVGHFLILDKRMPRSIAHCVSMAARHLEALETAFGRRTPAHESIQALRTRIANLTIDTIIADGLHEFLEGVISETIGISNDVAAAYRFTE